MVKSFLSANFNNFRSNFYCLAPRSINNLIKTSFLKKRHWILFSLNQRHNIQRCFECNSSILFSFCFYHWLRLKIVLNQSGCLWRISFHRFCNWFFNGLFSVSFKMFVIHEILDPYLGLIGLCVFWGWFCLHFGFWFEIQWGWWYLAVHQLLNLLKGEIDRFNNCLFYLFNL